MVPWWNNPATAGIDREQALTGKRRSDRAGSPSSLRLTVVFTTAPGTAAALKRAGQLARDLDFSLTFLVPQVVPYQVPITCPPVAIRHTRRMALSLISVSGLNAHDIDVQICLCRDRLRCLRQWIGASSIVFLGGQSTWWQTRERKLERALRALGCEVIFVDQGERRYA